MKYIMFIKQVNNDINNDLDTNWIPNSLIAHTHRLKEDNQTLNFKQVTDLLFYS